jgi:hypothetical protein
VEAEYVQFLDATIETEVITAFSKYGQNKFTHAAPDALDVVKKVAYMFNGCEIRSHADPNWGKNRPTFGRWTRIAKEKSLTEK